LVRARKKTAAPPPGEFENPGIDVNAVVSYNVRWVREHFGWTQEEVAYHLARYTGHKLPQASISAMERGFDGDRRRRFDAHELYLLATVFGVPIAFFFIPPPEDYPPRSELADTRRPLPELYKALLGADESQLAVMDERLAANGLTNPDQADATAAAIFGGEWVVNNWHKHFRTWRRQRLHEVEKRYHDRLEEVADFLVEFSGELKALGPREYLLIKSFQAGDYLLDKEGEPTFPLGRPLEEELEELRAQGTTQEED